MSTCVTSSSNKCGGSCKSKSTVAKPSNHNKRWSPTDDTALILGYAQGTGLEVMADKLGRTVVSILHRLSLNGLVKFDPKENAYMTVPTVLYKFN